MAELAFKIASEMFLLQLQIQVKQDSVPVHVTV